MDAPSAQPLAPGASAVAAPPTKVARPLWLKLVVAIGILTTVLVVVLGAVLLWIAQGTLVRTTQKIHLAVSADVARALDDDLEGAADSVVAVARLLTDRDLAEGERITLATTWIEASDTLDHALIYDAEGARLDTIKERKRPDVPDVALSEATRAQARRDGSAVDEVAVWSDGPHARVVAPVVTEDKEVTGYVATWASLDRTQARLSELSQEHFLGQPDALRVVTFDRRLILHPEPARSGSLEAIDLDVVQGLTPELLARRTTAAGDFTDAQGEAMFGVVLPLRRTPWVVVTQQPHAVAYHDLELMYLVLWSTAGVAALLALLVAVLLARAVTAPIGQLVGMAERLARRDFAARLKLETRDELSVLGGAMSQAAERLEESEARIHKEIAIRTDLGRYLPRELVDGVVRREHDMQLGGTRRPITVLFADVVAFTPLTERLNAEDVVAILNQLFTILTEIVFRHGGTVDKFIGDCVMAFWGAPTAQDDHAERALAAAEDMMRFLEVGNADWEKRYGITIQLAIGVNTGEAVVGNIGSETRMEYTAIGDAVNVAARLESLANPQQILITDATRAAAGDLFEYAPFGDHEVSGRSGVVQLFEVVL